MARLSVLVPARNEEWLNRTVSDVCAAKRGDTEVIVVLDGAWPKEPLPQHPDVHVVYLPQSIGQRAATNVAARISTADYIMKLDAHCRVADGFDVQLMADAETLGEDVTQIPLQYNLHVFDWVCTKVCGWRMYQGPTPAACGKCGAPVEREVIWQPRRSRKTTSWRFDRDLKFQYWGEWGAKHAHEDIHDVMSCLGACWFLSRQRYWQLGGLDEAHGSWGQMGTELGCKSWLSGGRMVVNKRTWFAHLFRTQGGDFSFPYPLSGSQVDRARKHSRALWKDGQWPGAVRPLSWLIDHFAPVPDWDHPPPAPAVKAPSKVATKGIVYYSDCRGDAALLEAVRTRLETMGLPIVSVTLKPVPGFGDNVVLDAERGYLTMFRQIMAGLERLTADVAFLCEHDVLYHPSHFDFTPTTRNTYYYNEHVWKVDAATGRALHYWCNQTSGLCADRRLLLNHYRARVQRVAAHGFSRSMGFEPGTRTSPHGVDDYGYQTWRSAVPNVDVRHGMNLTPSRWKKEQFRNQKYTRGWTEADAVPGWGLTRGRFASFLAEHTPAVARTA